MIDIFDDFFARYTKLQYKKGEIVLRAGDPPPGALYLRTGLVRMSFSTDSGDMLVLHVFRPGAMFPMPWIVNETANRYFFEALLPAEIWRAPREDVLKLFREKPETEHVMMSKMMYGLSGLMRRMEFLVFDSAYKKTVSLLLYYATHFASDTDAGKLLIALTHKEIAAWIGTTRETASLQVEILKKRGLIRYDKRTIIIPDTEKLEREIGAFEDFV